jgi:hypothetical protein
MQQIIEEAAGGYTWSAATTDTKFITAHDVFKNQF